MATGVVFDGLVRDGLLQGVTSKRIKVSGRTVTKDW
jgi:hypothetical protein